jgi:hypothetical protein
MTRKKIISDPETCASCRFFLLSDPKDAAGWCRRFPPRLIVVNDEADSALPVVLHDEWCGEYSRLLN